MSNKKVILLISLAFAAGFVISEFRTPNSLLAQVNVMRNLTYEELSGRINQSNVEIDAVKIRVATLEKSSQTNESKIANLTESVKKMLQLEKANMEDAELKRQISTLQKTVETMKSVQALQQSAIKTLQEKK